MLFLYSILFFIVFDSFINCFIFKFFLVCVIFGFIGFIENMKLFVYMWYNVLKECFFDIMKEYFDCVVIDRSWLIMLFVEDGSKDCF